MLHNCQLDLKVFLRGWEGRGYIDLRRHKEVGWQISLREEAFEEVRVEEEFITCRVAEGGYGVASTSRVDVEHIRSAMNRAQKLAHLHKKTVNLAPVNTETGYRRHLAYGVFDEDEAFSLLNDIAAKLKVRAGSLYARSEIILSHSLVSSSLVTSEGTEVCEEFPLTDIVIYLTARLFKLGYASYVAGGLGGLEVLTKKDWGVVADKLVNRAVSQIRASPLSPLERGKHFKVILDSEAAGALAHEVAHLLEGGAWMKRFAELDLAEDVEVIDDPTLPIGYGSFTWDSEGVKSKKKSLLSSDGVNGLHTRLTASDGCEAGNARGERTVPAPLMSNVYFKSSDWRVDEMLQDMRNGIYAEGVIRCDIDLSDGTLELTPEIAYLVEDKELKTPIKRPKLRGAITTILKRIDAVGRSINLRPNLEKGCRISEGGPYIRINGLQCS